MSKGLDGRPDIVLNRAQLHRAVAQYLDRANETPPGQVSWDIRISFHVKENGRLEPFAIIEPYAEIWRSEIPEEEQT